MVPTVEVQDAEFKERSNRLFIRREDQNHPLVSGNKWWKLKYNLREAARLGLPILTFGGAYSNHIFAVAAAGKELSIPTIGVIRGEAVYATNPTLTFARQQGMQLHFVGRSKYREKNSSQVADELRQMFGDFFLVPEGGTNEWALMGCKEWGEMLERENHFDVAVLAVGTGGTLAGLSQGTRKRLLGVSVLKDGHFLKDEVYRLSQRPAEILTEYHFGGYAKMTPQLEGFILDFERRHQIPLDPVYTGKALYATVDLIRQGAFSSGSSILFIHTGGLQGRRGFSF